MQTQLADFIKNTTDGTTADEILRKCVHCGFCTATCPTYQLLGDELESRAQIDEHVATCDACASRLERARAFDASFSIKPPSSDEAGDADNVVSLDARRQSRAPIAVLIAAAAAGVLGVMVWPNTNPTITPDDDDGIRMLDIGARLIGFPLGQCRYQAKDQPGVAYPVANHSMVLALTAHNNDPKPAIDQCCIQKPSGLSVDVKASTDFAPVPVNTQRSPAGWRMAVGADANKLFGNFRPQCSGFFQIGR